MATVKPEAFVVGISRAFTASANDFKYVFRSAAGLERKIAKVPAEPG